MHMTNNTVSCWFPNSSLNILIYSPTHTAGGLRRWITYAHVGVVDVTNSTTM